MAWSKKDVVGRKPTDNTTPTQQAPGAIALPGLNDILTGRTSSQGIVLDQNVLTGQGGDVLSTLTNQSQIGQLSLWLKKYGYSKKIYTNADSIKSTLQTDFPNILKNAKTFTDITNSLSNNYIPTAVGGGDGTGINISVAQKTDSEWNYIVDNTFQSMTLNEPTDKQREELKKLLQGIANKGTKTVTTKVGNVTKTVSTPSYSDADAKKIVEDYAKKASPEDYYRKVSFDFNSDMSKIFAGGL
jgi:hypothetical protein